jgi:hypothetical protein
MSTAMKTVNRRLSWQALPPAANKHPPTQGRCRSQCLLETLAAKPELGDFGVDLNQQDPATKPG